MKGERRGSGSQNKAQRVERLATSGQLDRIIRSVVGAGKPAVVIEEIRSRALFKLWGHREELRGRTDGELCGWAGAIVRSVVADRERQRAARARLARGMGFEKAGSSD